MTNSTDKAAASAAIRIAPRSGRVKAGVVLDRDGVTVVQSREGIDAIERAAYVAYPADCGNAPEDRAGFAARVIRSVVDKPNDCDVWANLSESVVYVLTLPVVKDADLDAVALLNASRVSAINPDETNFDYRLLGRTAGTDVPSLRAIAVSASQEGCEVWRSAFEKAGIKLAGLSSQELVPALLACRTPVDESWTTYAYMTVDAGESVLTIIENGRVALQRNFNFGMDQLLADAVERLSVTEEYDPNESPDDRRARLMLRVKQIFADEELLKTHGDMLASSLDAGVDRCIKYLERTFSYYERVEHGAAPMGLCLTADHGFAQVLARSLESKLGIPCKVRLPNAYLVEGAEDRVHGIPENFKCVAAFEALGLACSNETTPNLLDLPAERRMRARMHRLVRAGMVALGAATVCMLGIAAWCGLAWVEDGQALDQSRRQLVAIGTPLTARAVDSEMQRLEALESRGVAVLERRRFAGLLGELAAVRGDDVYIRSIELVPAGEAVYEDKKKSSRNERNEKARQTLVVVNVSLYGSAQEREASFAEFINRLEGLNRGGTMTVVTEDSVDNGVAYAIRMSGGF